MVSRVAVEGKDVPFFQKRDLNHGHEQRCFRAENLSIHPEPDTPKGSAKNRIHSEAIQRPSPTSDKVRRV